MLYNRVIDESEIVADFRCCELLKPVLLWISNLIRVHMKNFFLIILSVLMVACLTEPKQKQESVKVIIDTDMGSDCDDVGALALLNEYASQGKVEILGVIYSSGVVPFGTGVIDAINRYYGHDHIPVGASYNDEVGDPVDKMLAEKLARDTAAFGNRYIRNTDAVEQTVLNRRILRDQPDNSVVYITIGHTKGLYDLLVSAPDSISRFSGSELVSRKVKSWVALGALNANNDEGYYVRDWNFFFNGTAEYTSYLVDHFPKPVYFVDGGTNVFTGKSLIHSAPGNIVRTAYRDWLWNVEKKTLIDQRPSWDLVAVYFAVERPVPYFSILKNGYLEFDIRKGCRWIEKDTLTQHHYVLQKPGYEQEISDYLNQMISRPRQE